MIKHWHSSDSPTLVGQEVIPIGSTAASAAHGSANAAITWSMMFQTS